MAQYRVAGVQLAVGGTAEANLAGIRRYIGWAGKRGVDFLLFPEMALTGYHGEFSQEETAAALATVAEAAALAGVTVLLGTGWKEDGETFIEVRIYSEEGKFVGAHRKMVPTSGDREWCAPGHELTLFEHRGLRFGVLICNDLWVTPGCGPYPDPRLCYQLGQLGAQVVFQAVNSGSELQYVPYHESNLSLRARESSLYIVTANAVDGRSPANCSSGIMGPDGHWVARCPRIGEQTFVRDIEIAGA